MEQQIYIISATLVVYILFFVGALGSFLPILPGPLLAGVGLLAFKVLVPAASISWWLVGVGVAFAVIAQFLDLVTTWIGAKKFGATWRGALGAFVGVFVGIFLPPTLIWIFIAPLVFAFLFEWFGGATVRASAKAGVGAFVGAMAASVLKFLMVVFLAVWFTFELGKIYI